MFSYMALLPIIARYPKLVQAFADNIDDAERFFNDIMGVLNKPENQKLLAVVQELTPDLQQFISEAYQVIQNAR